MDLQLNGKTALVTGGSEGIGKAITRCLAREGVDVVICARRKDVLEAAAKELAKETGRKIIPIAADLTKDADAKAFIEQGHKALGRVDIMVNNAGSAPGGVIEHLSEADWEKGLQLKFMGYVRCLRYVLPIMVKQGGGRVVNLIGNDGVKPSYWEIVPGAANAAGQNLTKSLAGQYGKHNISFVAVNPGPVRTERWAGHDHCIAISSRVRAARVALTSPVALSTIAATVHQTCRVCMPGRDYTEGPPS